MNVDHVSLLQFLQKAEVLVSKALIQNIKSRAFRSGTFTLFIIIFTIDTRLDVQEETPYELLLTLNHSTRENGSIVRDMSWNLTGRKLAAAYYFAS